MLATHMGRHFADVIDALLRGRIVPFLGAGVNLCNRPDGSVGTWTEPGEWLPTGAELAGYLAAQFRYPIHKECRAADCERVDSGLDLAHVSQFGATHLGPGRLYEELLDVFDHEYPVSDVHRFLASLAFVAPNARLPWARRLLIVSTNYDDLMERAFRDRKEPFDLVFYDPETPEPGGSPRGRFLHQRPDSEPEPIERPNECDYPFLEDRPVILKIHGTVGRPVVITEDHYIDYLADEAFTKLPKRLLTRLCNSHLLFLGYSLRDWNFRVFLRRVKRNRTQDFTSWAVVKSTDDDEPAFWWERARVEIVPHDLRDYVIRLATELDGRGSGGERAHG